MSALDRFQLDRRVAIVTGGSRGIGRAIAIGLAEAGADVVVASRSRSSCEEVAAEIQSRQRRSLAVACDVSSEEDRGKLFVEVASAFGGVDIFVHAAGLPSVVAADDVDASELERMMRVHYQAGVLGAQLAAAQMRERGTGAILMLSSIWGLGAQPASIAYGSAKAAISHAVKVMAVEWARYGVRVNALAPGFVDTDMTAEMPAAVRDRLTRRIPMRRIAAPDELAAPAVFLCSDAARYVTGHVLVVDGGERAR